MSDGVRPPYRLEPLGKQHNRQDFACGVASLDAYLKTQASQDTRRKANAVFVLVAEPTPARIEGYCTLCSYALSPESIPEAARKHLPRYPMVSATLIGRLAIRQDRQGQALGSLLPAKALQKAYANSEVVGSSMVVVDAIDVGAASFYEAHGFLKLPESMRLILPMQTIAAASGPL